jgi:PAS domain S-box-containing protein
MNEPVDILIVDDHPENLVALEAILDRPDYRLIKATSGADALKSVLRHDFALLLLDVMMPRMDGFETARLIREREASRNLPIIFLTANATDVTLIYKAYTVGGVDYLIKPIDPNVVRAKVEVFVELHRKSRQIRRNQEQLRATERARSEQALRASEALYEATFRDAAVGIAHLGRDGRWLRVNPRLGEILGRPADRLLGMAMADAVHPDETGPQEALMSAFSAPHQTLRREARFCHSSGAPVWVNLTLSPLTEADDAQQVKTVVLTMEDVTARKAADERQRFLAAASEALLTSLERRPMLEALAGLCAATVTDWCLVALGGDDGQREVVAVHRLPEQRSTMLALERVLAGPAPEDDPAGGHAPGTNGEGGGEGGAAGEPAGVERGAGALAALLLHPTAALQGPDAQAPALVTRAGSRSFMRAPIRTRGRASGAVVFGAAGEGRFQPLDLQMLKELAQRIAFAADNATSYQQARAAIAVREEFLSIASHELRTPLTPLILYFQRVMRDLGRSETPLPPRLRETLAKCDRQLHRLSALVESLLDVSRISTGAFELARARVDLAEIARDVALRFGDQLNQVGCTLSLSADEPVVGAWDGMRLEQVLSNLLTNALKYGAGKPIEVAVTRGGRGGRLTIRDHGIGIEPDKLSRIFGRFERAASSSYGGLGLGLYIVKEIITAHGGTIAVESQPGQGTTFTVELPTQVTVTEIEAISPPPPSSSSPSSASSAAGSDERPGLPGRFDDRHP